MKLKTGLLRPLENFLIEMKNWSGESIIGQMDTFRMTSEPVYGLKSAITIISERIFFEM